MKTKVLLTGSTGFIGRALLARLTNGNFYVRTAVRNHKVNFPCNKIEIVNVGEFTSTPNWDLALDGINVVIHLAARAHVMNDYAKNSLAEYRRINVEASLNLANHAARAGVKRFIYLSSIKVNGEVTQFGRAFSADDIPQPEDAYGISKYEAELGLKEIAAETGMELVIIRPPLVYGPGVKANFLSMMRWLSRSFPLPFGAVDNLRSLVALENLVDLVVTCIDHARAANQIFLVSDDEDLSIRALLLRLGNALGKPALLFSVPVFWLGVMGMLIGSRASVRRLCSSLQVDISKTREILKWSPPVSVDEGLRKVAEDFNRHEKSF